LSLQVLCVNSMWSAEILSKKEIFIDAGGQCSYKMQCESVHNHNFGSNWFDFMKYHKIPDETVRRLPIYLRGLLRVSEQGAKNIPSRQLAEQIHLNPHQIRKDFSYFGAFGTCGVGYDVSTMISRIRGILKLNIARKAALVGVGRVGSALLGYPGFKMYGFEIAAVFDNDPKKIGTNIAGVNVQSISRLKSLKSRNINLAIITVPAGSAQEIADALVASGVNGILNFAPRYLDVPKRVKVITIDIAMDFARLPYYLPASRPKA